MDSPSVDRSDATTEIAASREAVAEPDAADAGISMTSVLVMLLVLAGLVVGIFWALPAWFGGQVIEVTIRN